MQFMEEVTMMDKYFLVEFGQAYFLVHREFWELLPHINHLTAGMYVFSLRIYFALHTLDIGAFGHNLVGKYYNSTISFYRVISMFVFSILTLLLAIGMIAKGTTVIVAESNYGHFDNFGKIC